MVLRVTIFGYIQDRPAYNQCKTSCLQVYLWPELLCVHTDNFFLSGYLLSMGVVMLGLGLE